MASGFPCRVLADENVVQRKLTPTTRHPRDAFRPGSNDVRLHLRRLRLKAENALLQENKSPAAVLRCDFFSRDCSTSSANSCACFACPSSSIISREERHQGTICYKATNGGIIGTFGSIDPRSLIDRLSMTLDSFSSCSFHTFPVSDVLLRQFAGC